MDFETFKKQLISGIKCKLGDDKSVVISHVIKNNGKELDGVVIMDKEDFVAPTIYVNEFYREHRAGKDFDEIVDEIIGVYFANKDKFSISPDYFDDFDNVRDKIVYKVVNRERNSKLLEDVPYMKVLDLAVIFFCAIDLKGSYMSSALIHENHLKRWKVDIQEVYRAAVENTPRLLKSDLRSMESMLGPMFGEHNEDVAEFLSEDMFILTNENKMYGASCMLYEDVLADFARKKESDLYILPSSIHEVIILPKNDLYDKHFLVDMVREVNREGVAEDEILSDNVYEYCRADGMISM